MSPAEAISAGGAITVMGPSGVGKSTLGEALGQVLGWHFIDGDSLHPPTNIEKMSRGEPLTDADRAPWLSRVGHAIRAHRERGVVMACSALKRAYRDRLRELGGAVLFVLPNVDAATLTERLTRRAGHFMPPSLLASQLQTLEPPGHDEWALRLPRSDDVAELAAQVRRYLLESRSPGT